MNQISKLFGGRPRNPAVVSQVDRVQQTGLEGEGTKRELLRRLATLRRATMTSELSTANVKRKTLGAGTVA